MRIPRLRIALLLTLLLPSWSFAQSPEKITSPGGFSDLGSNSDALPAAPAGFDVKFFAREPLVRQSCSMAFDAKGRLFIGMGPQGRHPTPETPGDSVVLVEDTNGDGVADKAKVFTTGLNCIQGLAWHGRDLWVANSPDFTAFGRASYQQGPRSAVEVKQGESLRFVYGAMLQEGKDFDPATEYQHFLEAVK